MGPSAGLGEGSRPHREGHHRCHGRGASVVPGRHGLGERGAIYVYTWREKSRPYPYPNPFSTPRKSSQGTRCDNRNWITQHHQSRKQIMLYCDIQPTTQTTNNTTRATTITRTIPITIPTISTIPSITVSNQHFFLRSGDASTDSRTVPIQDGPCNCVWLEAPLMTRTLNS